MSAEATSNDLRQRPTIWTVGHGDRNFDSVAAHLVAHGVQTIVDVRSQPYSKHAPDFIKGELEITAASAGFGYRWVGDRLGGRPIPSTDQLSSGLDEVEGLAATSHVALLCSETDPVYCHRTTVLTPALVARGFHIVHVLDNGTATPHQDTLLPDSPAAEFVTEAD